MPSPKKLAPLQSSENTLSQSHHHHFYTARAFDVPVGIAQLQPLFKY